MNDKEVDPPIPGEIDLVFLCAGHGARMGFETPKQFVELRGKPVMAHSLEVYEKIPAIRRKIIVHDPADEPRVHEVLKKYHISRCTLVAGGATRQDSVRAGIACASTARVLTHNAAVPFITPDMITRVMQHDADCVTTATSVKNNLVRLEKGGLTSVARAGLHVINSPQAFRTEALRHAHESASKANLVFNSDAELMLHFGHSLQLIPGPPWSFKITDRMDLALAETVLMRHDLFPALHP